MAKQGITWTSVGEDGERRQASAERVGTRWIFHVRAKRFDDWVEESSPSLEDWLALLDGVRRRVGRQLMRADEVDSVIRNLRHAFPDAEIPDA